MTASELRDLADDWRLEDNHKRHFGLWYRGPDLLRQAADELERLQRVAEAAQRLPYSTEPRHLELDLALDALELSDAKP